MRFLSIVFLANVWLTITFLAIPEVNLCRADQGSKPNEQLFWIFLTTGKSTQGESSEKIQEMQTRHLANFKRLAEEGVLLSAGPVSDPDKKLRGIVIVRASDREKLAEMFQTDPYVTSGYMKIEATPMEILQGAIRTRISPTGLDEFRIAVIEKSDTQSQSRSDQTSPTTPAWSVSWEKDDDVLLSVRLHDKRYGRVGILIMNKPENEQDVVRKINSIPAISNGEWQSQIIPLYLGKGTLVPS